MKAMSEMAIEAEAPILTNEIVGRQLRAELGLLTQEEIAAIAKVEVRTVERWRSDGCGPPFAKLGGIALYRKDALLKWLSQNETRKAPPRSRL